MFFVFKSDFGLYSESQWGPVLFSDSIDFHNTDKTSFHSSKRAPLMKRVNHTGLDWHDFSKWWQYFLFVGDSFL